MNLFCLHPPFQIDGNFGGTSGVAEMLMQGHEVQGSGDRSQEAGGRGQGAGGRRQGAGSVIHLLPALPDAWPNGKVTAPAGRAAGHQVDFEWKDGKVTSYRIRSKEPGEVKVRVNGETKTVKSEKL